MLMKHYLRQPSAVEQFNVAQLSDHQSGTFRSVHTDDTHQCQNRGHFLIRLIIILKSIIINLFVLYVSMYHLFVILSPFIYHLYSIVYPLSFNLTLISSQFHQLIIK